MCYTYLMIVAIDIGGTKIDAQLFPLRDGAPAEEPVWNRNTETQRGLKAHRLQRVRCDWA